MDDNSRDGAILEQRIAGRSVVALAEQYRCTTSDVDAVIDRRLSFDLTNDQRLKAIKLDTARLEALMMPFFERATKDRDVQAGTLCVKILERRALLLGLDQPTQSRVDVYQIRPPDQPTQHERIKAAILEMVSREQPVRREAINLLDKVGPQRALELLRAVSANGDGAADVPSLPDATDGGSSDPQ